MQQVRKKKQSKSKKTITGVKLLYYFYMSINKENTELFKLKRKKTVKQQQFKKKKCLE
jgi:hypothetical protein